MQYYITNTDLVMGVRGAAVRHMIMSDTAMLHTNRLIPV